MDSTPNRRTRQPGGERFRPLEVLLLSTWCALAAGEIEVGARVLRRNLSPTNQLYLMTRHFVWLVPLVDLVWLVGIGAVLALATRRWPSRAGWLSPRLIGSLAILSILLELGPEIYPEAWLLCACGLASFLAPTLERQPARWKRRMLLCLPVLTGMVVLQAAWTWGDDLLKQGREQSRPLPSASSPNVLLIVLDTVRADHLSLYGYPRPTTPNLARLAHRGIRFDRARAAAPWTLASHANIFTGLWPHELAIQWMRPLRRDVPTLAEYLGSQGYATAGFVGNTYYCSYDSGLDRGFTHYRDYRLNLLEALRTVRLVDLTLKTLPAVGAFLPLSQMSILKLSHGERKGAHDVNREFLDWVSHRRQPVRPFFAFLNYVDAHAPYVLPPGAECRFGPTGRQTDAEVQFLAEQWLRWDKGQLPLPLRSLARDSYDNCLAFLDDCLGQLLDDLGRRGVLAHTWVIVTADHGEGLGEHGLFDHGESLYRTEIHVPLLIVPPGGGDGGQRVVGDFVSLRDLAATVAALVRADQPSPLAGRPLIGPDGAAAGTATAASDVGPVRSELSAPNPRDPNRGRSPARRGPLVALAEGDIVYIRNQGDGAEELFDERGDPNELINSARSAAMVPILERFRAQFRGMKAQAQPSAPRPPRLAQTPRGLEPFGL